jgi:hypothetical protein
LFVLINMSLPEDDETSGERLERMDLEAPYREPGDWPYGTPEEQARERFERTGKIDEERGSGGKTGGLVLLLIGGIVVAGVLAGCGVYKLVEYVF